jgi:uncharacterized protein (TIGR02246 family)
VIYGEIIMKTPCILFMACLSTIELSAASSDNAVVLAPVHAFAVAFNTDSFTTIADFTTEDWVHINPFGGITSGRGDVVKELVAVHSTFLKGVGFTLEKEWVRFVAPDVAIVTTVVRMGTFTTPDGIKHENERHMRAFIVVRRQGRWLIAQDQNTIVRGP